jgi:hypothetical protein
MTEGEREEPAPANPYQDALDIVEAHLRLLTQKPLEETVTGLTDFERAKFKTTLEYAVATLQLCYLRTKGEDIEAHSNLKRLERLKAYFAKLDKFVDLAA